MVGHVARCKELVDCCKVLVVLLVDGSMSAGSAAEHLNPILGRQIDIYTVVVQIEQVKILLISGIGVTDRRSALWHEGTLVDDHLLFLLLEYLDAPHL